MSCNRLQVCILVKALDQILLSEFQGIHMNGICHIIHKTFHGKICLWNPISTHSTAYRCIGINGISLCPHIRTAILKAPGGKPVSYNGMSMGSIGTLVRISMHILCYQVAIFIHSSSQIILYGVSCSGIYKGFLSCKLQLYSTPSYSHRKKGI